MTTTFSLVTRGGHPDFLDLPWSEPLVRWDHHRLVPMARGISRHVVRFVAYDDRVYALKETTAELAGREFRARAHDLEIAVENVAGGVLDLQEAGLLPSSLDALELVAELEGRYEALWGELTRTDELDVSERHRIEDRIRRLNELGFDVEELAVEATAGGSHLRIRPVLVEEGHHSRELQRRTGLKVQENQARRLLNDIAAYRAWHEGAAGEAVSEAVAAARWMAEVYEPTVAEVPDALRGRLEPPELLHELLEHRWFLSEAHGREVTNEEALASLVSAVLPYRPEERTILAVGGADPDDGATGGSGPRRGSRT